MTRSTPAVTVVLPVYNAAPYLRQAVDSILAQTFPHFDLLAVDDGSTDESLALLRSYTDPRLRVVARPHAGVVRTMNAALALSATALVARADADDVCLPERLARQVAFLDAHPEVALVGGAIRQDHRVLEYPPDSLTLRWTALYRSPCANMTLLFRRSAALAVGGYPEQYELVDDYPFISSIIARWEAANLPDVLVVQRLNPTSITGRHRPAQLAEGDRTRRANIAALVPESDDADALFRLLTGRADAGLAGAVPRLLDLLLGAFRRQWTVGEAAWARLGPWIGGELFERALHHGRAAPGVLVRMVAYAWRLDPRLALRPATSKALIKHLLLPRARW